MSDTTCQAGDNNGFPIKLSQSLYTAWPATKDAQAQLQKLVVPTDFTVNWGPPSSAVPVSVTQTVAVDNAPGLFQIRGISTVTDSTTITFGNASYKCSGVLSIVQNQHKQLCQESKALYEVILAFQISNKSLNPSSPDIILLCRPIVFSTWNSSPFWPAVDEACVRETPQTVALDLSSIYAYNSTTLMPMITYQTCIPAKLLNYNGQPYSYGSIRIRVNVVPHPIYMVASENGLGKCSSINKYTLITETKRPVDVFSAAAANTILQFQDGYGQDLYPSQTTKENLVPNSTASSISAFSDLLQKFEILVPEAFLGKSLADIATATEVPAIKPKKKAFKCYTIDPEKDIQGDQIMVDPTTGQSLSRTMKKDGNMAEGISDDETDDYDISEYSSGIMPGDVEHITIAILTAIGTILLLAYLGFIVNMIFFRDNGFHDSLLHIVILIVLIICLTLFGIFVEKPAKEAADKTKSS
jgi:hypothetical protein